MPEQAQNPIDTIFLTLSMKAQTYQGLAIKPMNVMIPVSSERYDLVTCKYWSMSRSPSMS